jgi:hypothetical protein
VLEKIRFEANLKTHKDGKYQRKRSLLTQAKSLQRFVLLGLFALVPPSRQRVIRELELGRTLKYGIFEHGRFIPFEKMANPSEAKYYVHLQPEDYKTGDSYGEWLGEFPNTEFPDGSKFYDYLNRWLFQCYQDANSEWHGMRELIAAPGVKTVFVRDTGTPYTVPAVMTGKIRSFSCAGLEFRSHLTTCATSTAPTSMIHQPEPPQKRRRAWLTGCGILVKWQQKHIRT